MIDDFESRTRAMVNNQLFRDGKVNWEYFTEVMTGYRRDHEYCAAVDILVETGVLYKPSFGECVGGFLLSSGLNPHASWGGVATFVREQDAFDYSMVLHKNAIFSVYTHQVIRKANNYGDSRGGAGVLE